jgi:thiol:disulfide interchange protein
MFRIKPTLCFGLVAASALAAGCDMAGRNPAAPGNPAGPQAVEGGHGSVPFVKGYAEGFQVAQSEGKPMLVFFTAGWCHFCRQMAADTFTNEQVVEWSDRFVCIQVDAETEPDICRQFRVKGYPTVQFLSPQGVPLNRVVGKRAADPLISQMQAALGATASRSTPTVLR